MKAAVRKEVISSRSNLLEAHSSSLADFLGGQSVVLGLLSGNRELNIRQIRLLSERFHVSPAVFF